MGGLMRLLGCAVLIGLMGVMVAATSAMAAEDSPYQLDPILSLTGDCSTATIDPVSDPGCLGNPPAYPPPPGGPSKRFAEPTSIAIDPYGNEYVASYAGGNDAKGRVDVFDDEGKFITEVTVPDPKSIAVDSKGNLYVFKLGSGAVVRYSPADPYEPEAGKIVYVDPAVTVSSGIFVGAVAVDASNDRLYVARGGPIVVYSSAEEGNAELESFQPENIGAWPEAIAIDAQSRRIYVVYCENEAVECGVMVVQADPPHEVLEEIDGSTTPAGEFVSSTGRLPVAVDEGSGDFFVLDPPVNTLYKFNKDYEYVWGLTTLDLQSAGTQIAVSNGETLLSEESCEYPSDVPPGDACNRHYLFVPILESQGRALTFSPPNEKAPEIVEVSAASVGLTEAGLRATIDPNGEDTEYVFEYTTQQAFEEAGSFEGAVTAGRVTVVGEGTIPGEKLATKVSAVVDGLAPGTAYRFRVRAENGSGEAAEQGQNEATFSTYDDAAPSGTCSNLAVRVGLSAQLPDCRAYELVTPPETNGRSPKGVGFVGELFTTMHSSSTGGTVSYKIEGGSLPGSSGVGSFEGDPYLATRTASGWTNALAGVSGAEATSSIPGSNSPDQRYSFWSARNEGTLVIEGQETQYVRYPDGRSELIGRGSEGRTDPRASGKLITENGAHIIFQTENNIPIKAIQLESNAPPTGTEVVYDRTPDEVTHVVSLLPGNETPAAGQNAEYVGASSDGEGVAFEIGNNLYLRVGNETTYAIGEGVEFAGVSLGGARIFFVEEGDLRAFDTSSEEFINFAATGDAIPVNVAANGDRVYFVSPQALGATNPEGEEAIAPASGEGTLGAKGTGTLSSATGKGTLTSGPEVIDVSTEKGEFKAGMQISGSGIPAGTTITAVGAESLRLSNSATQSGPTSLTAGSTRVTGVSTSQGVFQVGMQISGTGIPADTTITAVTPSTLTLSKGATESGSTSLTAGSTLVTGVSTAEGEFRVGMNITASGIPAGTTITAIDETAGTLTLSKEASATGDQALAVFAQNLYLSDNGAISFVATVTARDVEGAETSDLIRFDGLGLWTEVVSTQLAKDPSRTNPDGSVFLFQSRANLTGYEESQFPQIYRYDTDAGTLQCISCIPTGAAASAGASLETYSFDSLDPPPFSSSGFVPNVTPDGKRVFFESREALVSTDTNGVQDVYEWESQDVGSCTKPGGCVYLISSGRSPRDNFLYAHSQSGDDVFFTTGDVLTGWDRGPTVSIYDAKVGGGFPEPVEEGGCSGEGCRPTMTPPPGLERPRAGGEGDVTKPRKICPKGKRKVKMNGRVRCVKKKHKKQKGGKAKTRAGANRGAGK